MMAFTEMFFDRQFEFLNFRYLASKWTLTVFGISHPYRCKNKTPPLYRNGVLIVSSWRCLSR